MNLTLRPLMMSVAEPIDLVSGQVWSANNRSSFNEEITLIIISVIDNTVCWHFIDNKAISQNFETKYDLFKQDLNKNFKLLPQKAHVNMFEEWNKEMNRQ